MTQATGTREPGAVATPRRVLVVQPDSDMYGACRSLLRTLTHLPSGAYDFHVAFPYDGQALGMYRAAGCTVFIEPSLAVLRRSQFHPRGILSLMWMAATSGLRLRKYAREHEIGIVHSNSAVVLSGAVAAMLSRRPHVWHVREYPTDRIYMRTLLRLLLRFGATVVVPISRACAELAGTCWRVQLVPNGYSPTSRSVPRTGAVPGVDYTGHRVVIASIARLSPTKGQDLLLDAVAALPDEVRARVEVYIAGTAYRGNEAYAEGLVQQASSARLVGRVHFLGFLDDPTSLYERADLVCLTTRTGEGFATVALEAMAHGIPVIAATAGGVDDLLPPGMDVTSGAGCRVQPDDCAALCQALAEAITNDKLRAQWAAHARDVAARFTLEASAQQLGIAYDLALGATQNQG